MKLQLNNGILDFFDTSRGRVIYQIPKQQLDLVLQINNINISDWIHQISRKSWASKTILHELAKIIQQEFPNNTIDWVETYSMIDKI
jgi:hypothetical protein